MSPTVTERVTVSESEIASLRSELSRLKTRQERMDSSVVQLIRTWQPLLLTIGETIVDLAKGSRARTSSLRRLRKGMTAIREMLPAVSQDDDASAHKQA